MGGGYWTAVGGHPHWIGIGSQYAWGGGVLDGGGRAPPLDWHRLTVRVGGGRVLDGGGRAPPLDWHRLTVRVGGRYLMAVGGHPHSIGIGSQYTWGGGG